jgi:uncharacterized membrane protein (UPF0127 family)
MKKTILFIYNKKKFQIKAKLCNSFEKFFGLMFKNREKSVALLFEFKKPVNLKIHSLFVFFPFVAVWFDNKNKIVDLKMIKPFTPTISPKKSFSKLLEIPINKRYSEKIKLLVGD